MRISVWRVWSRHVDFGARHVEIESTRRACGALHMHAPRENSLKYFPRPKKSKYWVLHNMMNQRRSKFLPCKSQPCKRQACYGFGNEISYCNSHKLEGMCWTLTKVLAAEHPAEEGHQENKSEQPDQPQPNNETKARYFASTSII